MASPRHAAAPTGGGGAVRLGRAILKRVVAYGGFIALALLLLWLVSIRMPGRSFSGLQKSLTASQDTLRARLTQHVEMMAARIGERNSGHQHALDLTKDYITRELSTLGYSVREYSYLINSRPFTNIEATLPGTSASKAMVVVGGHYDSVIETPGADDNASGVAGVIELARLLRATPHPRAIRFVAFTNEEPPYFWTEDMGSLRYARMARARGDSIVAMLSLECIGYFSDSRGSQKYPPVLGWFYPKRGDFIGFVGNIGSRSLVHRAISSFREHADIPSAGSAAPPQFPGIGWSDHWSFWKAGYPALMVTTTAPFRDPHYHQPSDSPEKLDYDRMARVVSALALTIGDLSRVD